MLACSFDLRANAVGFLCALGSTLIFVSQNIFSKKLLPKDGGSSTTNIASSLTSGAGREGTGKLDKLNLLFYSSGMAFVLMIPIWLWTDAALLFSTPVATTTSTTTTTGFHSLLLYFWLNGTVHFTQNLLAFSILSKTSPVTYSIASLVKRIAVICLAIIWSGQVVTLVQGLGMTMTFFGLWLYNRAKGDVEKGERKRGLIEKRASMSGFLPTTGDEARVLSGGTETPPLPLPNSLHRPSYTSVDTDPDFKTLPQQQSHPPQLNHYSSPPTYVPSPMSIVNPPPPPPPPSTAAATTTTQTLSAHKSPTLTKSSPPTTTATTGQQGNYRRVYHQPPQYTPLSPPQPPPPLPQHQAIPIHR
jgi:solute carrier family 35 protein E1